MKLSKNDFIVISEMDQCEAFLRENEDLVSQILDDATEAMLAEDVDEDYLEVVASLASYFMLDMLRKERGRNERKDSRN